MRNITENGIRLNELVEIKRLSKIKALRLAKKIIEAYESNKDLLKDNDITDIVPPNIVFGERMSVSFDLDVAKADTERYKVNKSFYEFLTEDEIEIYKVGLLLNYLFSGGVIIRDRAAVKRRDIEELISSCLSIHGRQRFRNLNDVYKRICVLCDGRRRFVKGSVCCISLGLLILGSLYLRSRYIEIAMIKGDKEGYYNGYKNGYEETYSDLDKMGIVPAIIEEKRGNLQGNINEGSKVVFYNDDIYFIENGKIYVMDSYDCNPEVLYEEKEALALAVYEEYLYFAAGDSLYKTKLDKFDPEVFLSGISGVFMISDDVLYVRDSQLTSYYYKVDLKNNSVSQMGSKNDYYNLLVQKGKFIYLDDERGVSLFDAETGEINKLNSNNFVDLCEYQDKIYGIAQVKVEALGMLVKYIISMRPDGSDLSLIKRANVNRISVTNAGIFGIEDDSGNLIWISEDLRRQCVILESDVDDFNVAGRWILYHKKGDNDLWMVHTDGSQNRKVF